MHPATLSCGRVTHHLACHPANTFGHQKGTKSLSEGKVEDQLSGALRFGIETGAGSKSVEVRLYNTSLCVCLKMLAASCVCARVPLQKLPCNPVHNHEQTHSSANRTGESLLLHLLLEGQDMVLLLFQL